MKLTRRSLLATTPMALPLALPGLRRAAARDIAARLSLLHINDMHSRHDPVDGATGAACRPGGGAGDCLGGSTRLVAAFAAARAAARAEGRATLALDAGDQFMGSLFHTHHRGAAELAVMRAWGCEAMAPGNHEFNRGPGDLARFAADAPFPLLSANLDARAEPLLRDLVRPWTRLDRGGARIALIGLTTESTPDVSSPGPTLRFEPAEAAVERALHAIRREPGPPATVILLSHRGLEADRALAARIPGVDAIVGGHSHSLLAALPGAEGPHPVLVDGTDRPVRIVQAGAFGRWLGRLDLDLGADGRVLAHGGGCQPVSADLPEDPAVAALLATLAAPLRELRRRPVAETLAAFDTAGCREGECPLGSLVAEAMLAAAPGAEVALHNGGGLRAGLPAGPVAYGDVLAVLPFGNTLARLRLRGADLLAALENGLSRPGGGRFPQVAGLRLAWDPAAPPGRRILAAETGGDGGGGQAGAPWTPVDPERVYRLVTNDFLRRGGDGYAVLRDRALEAYDSGPLLEEVAADWMAARSPLRPRLDGRITALR